MSLEIPYHLQSLTAEEVGGLLKYKVRYVCETLVKKTDFPKRCDAGGKPRWKASEILAWRDAQQRKRGK